MILLGMLGMWEIIIFLGIITTIIFSYVFTYRLGVKKGLLKGELNALKK